MKKLLSAGLALAVILSLTGCVMKNQGADTFGSVTNGLYLYENQSFEDVTISDFEKDYYDADEYRTFLEEDVQKYNDSHEFFAPAIMTDEDGSQDGRPQAEKPVTVTEVRKEKGKLYQRLLYANADDFLQYNEAELAGRGGNVLYAGSLKNAGQEVFAASFTDQKGEAFDVNAAAASEKSSYLYAVVNFECVFYGDGELAAFSGGSYSSDVNAVLVGPGETVILIYKIG